MENKYQAIMLGKFNVGETDRLYSFYSLEAGKNLFIARGTRKSNAKLSGALEAITYTEIFVSRGRGRGQITGAIPILNFSHIKQNFFSLEKVFYVFKIFDQLISQEEKDGEIFALLLEYLEMMEKNSKKEEEKILERKILTLGFLFKILEKTGYGLQMRKCVICSRKLIAGENWFSPNQGGTLCAQCSQKEKNKIKIKDEAIKTIRIFLENKIGNFEKIKINSAGLSNLEFVAQEALRWIVG